METATSRNGLGRVHVPCLALKGLAGKRSLSAKGEREGEERRGEKEREKERESACVGGG